MGETKKTDTHSQNPNKPRNIYYEAQAKQVDNRKAKHGILYKYDKEGGTRITNINLSGSD
eukprot:9568947-Heterocapsa_arctica.AAC.1